MVVTVYNNNSQIEWGVTGTDRIIQNVRNILRTRKFEVPFMREMGIRIDNVDASPRQVASSIMEEVTELIGIYENRAKVIDVSVESVDENGECIIAVKLEV